MCCAAGVGGVSLLDCVKTAIGVEQSSVETLPEVTGFTTSITGHLAVLQRSHGNQLLVQGCMWCRAMQCHGQCIVWLWAGVRVCMWERCEGYFSYGGGIYM